MLFAANRRYEARLRQKNEDSSVQLVVRQWNFALTLHKNSAAIFGGGEAGRRRVHWGEGKEHAMQALWHDCIFAHTGIPQDCQKCAPKVKCKRQRYSPRWNLKILSWRFQVVTELSSVGQ